MSDVCRDCEGAAEWWTACSSLPSGPGTSPLAFSCLVMSVLWKLVPRVEVPVGCFES